MKNPVLGQRLVTDPPPGAAAVPKTPVQPRRWTGWLIGLGSVVVIGSVAAFAGGTGLWGNAHPPQAQATAPAPIVVTVAEAVERSVPRSVTVVGSLWGFEEIAITPKVEGRVLKIHHDVGDIVQPGDKLLELDRKDYELTVAELRRGLELELAKLGLTELPTGPVELTELPTILRATARVKNTQSRRDRMLKLFERGTVPIEERDTAETEFALARADLAQASLEVQTTLAAARQRQAMLDTALQKLADTHVHVPCPELPGLAAAGSCEPGGPNSEYVICKRSVSAGEIVRTTGSSTDQELFQLVFDRTLKLRTTVPERHRSAIELGQTATVRVEAYPGETFTGKVGRIHPSIDRASRTFQVEVYVPNEERRLSPGSFAKVSILTATADQALTVPEEAIVSFAGVDKLFVIRAGIAHAVPVRIVTTLAVDQAAGEETTARTWVEVEGKLAPGEQVVTTGQVHLAEGSPVRVRTPIQMAERTAVQPALESKP